MARKFLTGINMNNYPITGLPAPTGAGQAAEYSWVLNQIASSSTAAADSQNLLINGAFNVDQRSSGATKTVVAGAALVYNIDRWWSACTGANVTAQQVAGTSPNAFNYSFTGASGVTGIKLGQRIEAINSQHIAGSTVSLSVDLANTLLTTVTWTAYYANTKDTFGSLASPTKTQIATGTFTVNGTLSRYSTTITIPAAATTGIEIVLSVGAQTSGNWIVGRVQLESSLVPTKFQFRHITRELILCQRYFCSLNPNIAAVGTTSFVIIPLRYPVTMRATPTLTIPFVDANYTATGSPTGTQWCVQQLSVKVVTKAGTIIFMPVASSTDSGAITFINATFNVAGNWISSGSSVSNITLSAEL